MELDYEIVILDMDLFIYVKDFFKRNFVCRSSFIESYAEPITFHVSIESDSDSGPFRLPEKMHKWMNEISPYNTVVTILSVESRIIEISINRGIQKPKDKKSIYEIAMEVIQGKWDYGPARIQKIKAAGYDYNEVQSKVNKLILEPKERKYMEYNKIKVSDKNEKWPDWEGTLIRTGRYDPHPHYLSLNNLVPVIDDKSKEVIANYNPSNWNINYNIDWLIEKVIFNAPATIVMWKDGQKTVVKCGEDDIYDPEKGLAMCIAKRVLGNKGSYYDIFKEFLPVDYVPVEVEEGESNE